MTKAKRKIRWLERHLQQLKLKYQSVLNFMQSRNVLKRLNLQDNTLFRATALSQDIRHSVSDQVKLVDPNCFDLIADIEAPAATAAAVASGSSTTARTYIIRPGDSLSKSSKEFYLINI